MGIAAEVPSVLVRQPTDTRKGQMWYDLKMTDWVFKIFRTTGTQIAERLVQIGHDLSAARESARQREIIVSRTDGIHDWRDSMSLTRAQFFLV